jgi:hypothetical protein
MFSVTTNLSDSDYELRFLLDLNGITYHMSGGYWVKFDVRMVEPTREVPHGVRYSLTLHDRNNSRVVGYDNAHGGLPRKGRYQARKSTWDHVHKQDRIYPYEFDSAAQLLEDFWNTVEEYV